MLRFVALKVTSQLGRSYSPAFERTRAWLLSRELRYYNTCPWLSLASRSMTKTNFRSEYVIFTE